MIKKSITLIPLLLLTLIQPKQANGAAYWFQGVLDSHITLCFVGNALTSRPDRVNQILDVIAEFEQVANINFDYLGSCPPPTTQSNGDDYFDGDIRLMIPDTGFPWDTGPVPGKGCPIAAQSGGSWSAGANDLEKDRPCMFNMRIGDDPWNGETPYANTTLHEFGHMLGLIHEHERVDSICYDPSNDVRWLDDGFLTPYDIDSVMHYKFSTADGHTCDTNGNYDHTGLSHWDQLALHILYPEDNRVAEFVGNTVVPTDGELNLQSSWLVKGANIDFVAHSFVWRLNGQIVSTVPALYMNAPAAGDYLLEFFYSDFLDRHYYYQGPIKVLSPDDFAQYMASTTSTIQNSLLFTSAKTTYTMPASGGSFIPESHVRLDVDAEAFTSPVILRYSPQKLQDVTGLQGVGIAFSFDAISKDGTDMQPASGSDISLTVRYPSDSAPNNSSEEDLALYFWDGNTWMREPTSVTNVEENTISIQVDRWGKWAIFKELPYKLYLPFTES